MPEGSEQTNCTNAAQMPVWLLAEGTKAQWVGPHIQDFWLGGLGAWLRIGSFLGYWILSKWLKGVGTAWVSHLRL